MGEAQIHKELQRWRKSTSPIYKVNLEFLIFFLTWHKKGNLFLNWLLS